MPMLTKQDSVILVDEQDRMIGTMEKIAAHAKAKLHRAFSVFLFSDDGRMLLQQRAKDKYHSGGLWTNTCCSHPKPGETVSQAASRRLEEEMGIRGFVAEPLFSFIYRVDFNDGLTEHEFDHVLVGSYNLHVLPNPDEVQAFRYVSFEELDQEVRQHPERFTYWFQQTYKEVFERYQIQKENSENPSR